MASRSAEETFVCTFRWRIENMSHGWWLREERPLASPRFTADALDGTRWSLIVYPAESKGENIGNTFALKLFREIDCGPDFKVEYHLAFLGEDGSILEERTNIKKFVCARPSSPLLLERKEKALPEDSLTVQCTLRKAEMGSSAEGLPKSEHLYATTILKVMRRTFDWQIDYFNETVQRKKFEDDTIHFDLVYEGRFIDPGYGGRFIGELDMDMISYSANLNYFSCNTSVMDSEGEKESWGIKEYSFLNISQEESLLLELPKKILENRKLYLQDDVLTLVFDIVLSTVEHSDYRRTSVKRDENENKTVLIEDLKSMHSNDDMELRTSTKSSPAAKNILNAPSPVLNHAMQEQNSGVVDINDSVEDAVNRMLKYMCTGLSEDLQIDNASKLFAHAVKNKILFLKDSCSSFLKENLSTESVCKILLLADQQNDEELRKAVEVYIMLYDTVASEEWKIFMKTNLELAARTMYRNLNHSWFQ